MKEHYPYRFKIESEFLDEFGHDWRNVIDECWNPSGEMDYLYGKPYPFFIEKGKNFLSGIDRRWTVSWDMLTENILLTPTYKPKEKVIRSI